MQLTFRTSLAVAGLALLLVPPTVSQDQCNLPTDQDVTEVVKVIYTTTLPEGTALPTVEELFQVHFTCLATVALDMYASATVVANFTTTESSESTVEQFQLKCFSGGVWGASPSSGFKNQTKLPAKPFTIEEQDQCFQCEEKPSTTPNYDSDSNCLFCADECLEVGGGFCTGDTADDCCPVFNSETGACVDNCTVIDTKFGPDENFTCVCIPCDPGYTQNSADCSCELTDGCEATGQPCQNGGTCVSYLSALAGGPYYNCTCANGFSGKNCTMCSISCDPGYTLSTMTCSCDLTDGCEAAGQPCRNGGTCTSDLSAFPYYSCQCVAGSTGQNCDNIEADNLLWIIIVVIGVIIAVIIAVIIVGIVLLHIYKKPRSPSIREDFLLPERNGEQPREEIPETVEENQDGEELSLPERAGEQPCEDIPETVEENEQSDGQELLLSERNGEQPCEEIPEPVKENEQSDGEVMEIREENNEQLSEDTPESEERSGIQTNEEMSEAKEGSDKQPTEDVSQTQLESREKLKEEVSKTEEGQEEQPNGETNAMPEIDGEQPNGETNAMPEIDGEQPHGESMLEIKDENGKQPNDGSLGEKERHVKKPNEGDHATEEQQEE